MLLWLWLVILQPWKQRYWCRGCGGHRCSPGSRAPAADSGVRYVPGCVYWVVVCARTEARVDGMCFRCRCCACGLCLCSLGKNCIGAAGAVAIAAGLVHVPQLQTLKYVVCLAVCAGPWYVLARERGAMACDCAVVCGLFLCSLHGSCTADAGAAAIGAGLVHVPQLQTLKYVVCPAECAGSWCVLAQEFALVLL